MFAAAKGWDAASGRAFVRAVPSLASAVDSRGRRALQHACAVKPPGPRLGETNGLATAQALLDTGADLEAAVPMPNEGDLRGTPLWYAVARGENLPLVRFLLKRGADASWSLWAAVWRDADVMLRDLLKMRLCLNRKANGETAFFHAAWLQRLKTLDLLIGAGADPTIADDRGRDARSIGRERRLPKPFIDRLGALATPG